MKRLSRCVAQVCVPVLAILALLVPDSPAIAGVLEQVDARETDEGYQLRISLSAPMSYQRHSPQGAARDFIIDLQPQPVGRDADDVSFQSRDQLGFGQSSLAPVQEIIYDGADGGRPTITLRLTRAATIDVSTGRDLKTLIVDIMPVGVTRQLVAAATYDDRVAAAEVDLKLGPVMAEARQALVAGKLDRAINFSPRSWNRATAPCAPMPSNYWA